MAMRLDYFTLHLVVIHLLIVLWPGVSRGGHQLADTADQHREPVVIFLSGDLMLGRAIDQILPFNNDPVLYEDHIRDARAYVRLAERANGPIRKPVDCSYIWGDALEEFRLFKPDASIINLETSVTQAASPWKRKYIHYRMHPRNVDCITAANIDVAVLANNHVLDWGYGGLAETLLTLERAGIATAGAGDQLDAASQPAIVDTGQGGRVLVSAWAHASSGVPDKWAATVSRPGVNRLDFLGPETVHRIGRSIKAVKRPGDIAVLSIHWGGNWGYAIPPWQVEFAHRLIDEAGIDVVHGHSSHHVKGIEVYKGKLIIYGSGDLLNDYEGIGGHEAYRADLALMYFAGIDPATGRLVRLQMTPTLIRRLRINKAGAGDAAWLKNMLDREGQGFNTRALLLKGNRLGLDWE